MADDKYPPYILVFEANGSSATVEGPHTESLQLADVAIQVEVSHNPTMDRPNLKITISRK